MNVVIVGPGAIGSLFAALFARHSAGPRRPIERLTLLDKDKERAARIAKTGITVETPSGSWQTQLQVTAELSAAGEPDLIILCVKSYDTKEAVAGLRPLIGSRTKVLTLQNGIGNIELIGEIIGEDRVIGGATNMGATLLAPGKIRLAGKGETVIGRMDGELPIEIRPLREIFSKAGLQLRSTRDLKGLVWSKLIVNAAINPLTALTRLPNGKLLESAGMKKLLRDAAVEAVKIAKRKRIKLLYDDPLAKVEAVCEATSPNLSSMLQDVLNRKRTEIDFINGVIVRLGQELGIAVPVNSMLVELIKTIEASFANAAGSACCLNR